MSKQNVQERYLLYLFLQRYYAGQFLTMDYKDWKQLCISVESDFSLKKNELIQAGFEKLLNCTKEEFEVLEFDFNRLFVGPGKLLAAPYEAAYLNQNRVLMQRETLAVRRFYQQAELELVEKNHEPDDHIALELEFICYLFQRYLENDDDSALEMIDLFLQEHLILWTADFCETIRTQSTHPISLGMADVLEGILQFEKTVE